MRIIMHTCKNIPVTILPLKTVHQRPSKVSSYINSVLHRGEHRAKVIVMVLCSVIVDDLTKIGVTVSSYVNRRQHVIFVYL